MALNIKVVLLKTSCQALQEDYKWEKETSYKKNLSVDNFQYSVIVPAGYRIKCAKEGKVLWAAGHMTRFL